MVVDTIEKSFEQIRQEITDNIASWSDPIDSYYEDHIIESSHYEIRLDNEKCGYCSVFECTMLTQFSLMEKFIPRAQEIFQEVLVQRKIQEIYLSTSDKLLMTLALDVNKKIIVQDYVFQAGSERFLNEKFFLTRAQTKDIPGIRNTDEGFFKNLEKNVENGELWVGKVGHQVVSYGIIENSKLFDDLASIGIFVPRDERGKGYGALTIMHLKRICQNANIRPIAGCFVKNQYSVNALKKAGMVSMNRLLKVKI